MSLLHEHGLTQHVNELAYAHSHILDIVITRDNSSILQSSQSIDENYLSDSKGISSVDHKGITPNCRNHGKLCQEIPRKRTRRVRV